VVAIAAPAAAGDFMDTRLTWTFGDEDVTRNAGEVVPDSPRPGIGDRKGYELFMDSLNSKTKGRENLTHIALYKKMDGYAEGLTTEAGVVLKIDLNALTLNTNPGIKDVLADDGTFLRLAWSWKPPEEASKYFIGATFFPFDTERFRLGYLWDISWGGGNVFTTSKAGPAPGMKLEVAAGAFTAYAGVKTAKVSQVVQLGSADVEQLSVQEMNYGVLGGFGLEFTDLARQAGANVSDSVPGFRLDAGAGWFQQGTFNFNGLIGVPVYTLGVSGRFAAYKGLPIQTSIDMMLYRNDPNVNVLEWWKERYEPGKLSWSLSVEFSYLMQRLADNQKYGTTLLQGAYAGAFQGKLKYGHLRAQVNALIRNLEFILQNVPSLTPFVAIPSEGISTKPEYFVAATLDYYFESVHLMPYLTGGVQFPASYQSGDTVQVIRDVARRDRLPPGFDAAPVIQTRLGLQWDLSDFMSLLANLQYVRDENLTRLKIDAQGERREFQRPDQVGFTFMARARF
jgi:hypothetical protein